MSEHKAFDVTRPGGRMKWLFSEFWPLGIFVVLFLLMVALPLTLSGMMLNPFIGDASMYRDGVLLERHRADVVWPGYGLLLIVEFLVAVAIVFIRPGLLGLYMVALAAYGLIAAERFKAWYVGSDIAVLFLMYLLVGLSVFLLSGRGEKKRPL